MKTCSSCKNSKPLSDFGPNKSQKDGLMRQCKICNSARALKHYNENKKELTARKRSRRFERHGITKDIFEKQLKLQGGVCYICKKEHEEYVVDHDHTHCPGTWGCVECFRGVLCKKCNRGIGHFEDSPEMLRVAAEYLDVWRNGSANPLHG